MGGRKLRVEPHRVLEGAPAALEIAAGAQDDRQGVVPLGVVGRRLHRGTRLLEGLVEAPLLEQALHPRHRIRGRRRGRCRAGALGLGGLRLRHLAARPGERKP